MLGFVILNFVFLLLVVAENIELPQLIQPGVIGISSIDFTKGANEVLEVRVLRDHKGVHWNFRFLGFCSHFKALASDVRV